MASYTQASIIAHRPHEEIQAEREPPSQKPPAPLPAQLSGQIQATLNWHTAKVERKAGPLVIGDQNIVSSVEQLHAKKRAIEKSLMSVGRRYEGVSVFVGGSTRQKGLQGVVIGDYDSAERAARLKNQRANGIIGGLDQAGVMLTIKDRHGRPSQEKIENVWHHLRVFSSATFS